MGIRLNRARDGVGVSLIAAAGILMSATALTADPVGSALCGVEGGAGFSLMNLMPIYFMMMIVGIGDSAKHYAKYFLTEGYSRTDLKRLFLGFVVSGGSVLRRNGRYCVRYYGKDEVMHRMFCDLGAHIYGSMPQTVQVMSRGTYMSQLYSKPAVMEICEFSPEMASRRGETPTINYILEGDRRVKVEAARVIMSTAGWITCMFPASDGWSRTYPRLGYGSVLGVKLASELEDLMEAVPLQMKFYGNKNYGGRGCLATTDRGEMQSFLRSGGFYEGSTVKKGAFSGVGKNRLLQTLVDTHGREYTGKGDAIEFLSRVCNDDSVDLNLYMSRIMLG